MKMMRIPEAIDALGGRIRKSQLYSLISREAISYARVGGVLLVDLDQLERQLENYVPYAVDATGLVSKAELQRRLGLSQYVIDTGVAQGWILQYDRPMGSRPMYDPDEVRRAMEQRMRGGEKRDNRRRAAAAEGSEAGGAGPG